MSKLVVLKLGDGDFGHGFSVTLQIGEDGERPSIEITGKLPPAPQLQEHYNYWQSAYLKLGVRYRLENVAGKANRGSFKKDCSTTAQVLCDSLNTWLQSESFLPVREEILENIKKTDEVRVLLQTQDILLQRLPWQRCHLFARYPKAQIALSAQDYKEIPKSLPKAKVRILAIFGDSTGINTEVDLALLKKQLPKAEILSLVEPQLQKLTEKLWDKQGWDVLFFAGHSLTQADGKTGVLQINKNHDLTIEELKNALHKAVERGLKLAFFNSCEGLGLARNLADLSIPQIIVMREPVPDKVAQEFLKYFLEAFALRGESLYLAVKEAQEKLQGLENEFPCASWLPVIYQNPTANPPTWQQLCNARVLKSRVSSSQHSIRTVLIGSVAALALVMGIRQFGLLQYWELKAFDGLMQRRPKTEGPDPRLLIIKNTEADVQAQTDRRGSLSNGTLNQLIDKLEQYQPALIGLDIYRDLEVEPQHKALLKHYQQNHRFITICMASGTVGTSPPPALLKDKDRLWQRVGFSDVNDDEDGILRRHLLAQAPPEKSLCKEKWSFSYLLADRYINQKYPNVPIKLNDPNLDVHLGNYIQKILGTNSGGYQQIDNRGFQLLLNYRATDLIAPTLTLSEALNGKLTSDLVKNKIVLIGVTDPTFKDFHLTPYSNNAFQTMSGVEVQAHMVSQLLSAALDKRPLLWYLPDWGEILWVGIWAFVGGIISQYFRSKIIILLAAGVAILILYGCCYLLFLQGAWMPLVPSALTLMAGGIVVFVYTNFLPENKL